MGSLFSKKEKKPDRITEQDKAVLWEISSVKAWMTNLFFATWCLLGIAKTSAHDKSSTKNLRVAKHTKSLKQQRDKLKQYQKKINLNLGKEREVAKKLLKDGKTDKAKLLLKKKRYQEGLLTKTDDQLQTIDKLIHDVEFAQIELKVVEGLKQGNEALKKIHEVMSLEDVEKIMEDTKEAVEYQNEIDELISGGLTQEDEEDILKELEELNQMEELPSVPEDGLTDNLSDVPSQEPSAGKKKKVTENRTPIAAT